MSPYNPPQGVAHRKFGYSAPQAGVNYGLVHQFEIPSKCVGRLIGKQGSTISSIMFESGCNLTVYLHPLSQDLRLCSVEGTHDGIKKALDMIRDLFPKNRFPDITLHQVLLPEQISPPVQVALGIDSTMDVILSSMISAGHFFLQSPSHPTFQSLAVLDGTMLRSYTNFETPMISAPSPGMIVAAFIMEGWYRALIVDVPQPGQALCKFVDYGGYSCLDLNCLRQIRLDFMSLPFQACECYLSDVAPLEGKKSIEVSIQFLLTIEFLGNQWSVEANAFLEQLVVSHPLKAQVTGYTENGCNLVRLYRQDIEGLTFVNELLVNNGFAKWINGPPTPADVSSPSGLASPVDFSQIPCQSDDQETDKKE